MEPSEGQVCNNTNLQIYMQCCLRFWIFAGNPDFKYFPSEGTLLHFTIVHCARTVG